MSLITRVRGRPPPATPTEQLTLQRQAFEEIGRSYIQYFVVLCVVGRIVK